LGSREYLLKKISLASLQNRRFTGKINSRFLKSSLSDDAPSHAFEDVAAFEDFVPMTADRTNLVPEHNQEFS
jgi:hypothetical protein